MNELEKDFKITDIPSKTTRGESNVWYELAEKFEQGKDVLLYLTKNSPGERLYVPHYDNIMRPVRERTYLK